MKLSFFQTSIFAFLHETNLFSPIPVYVYALIDESNRRSRFVNAKLALAAMNMAESANDAIGLEETLKIYLNVVIMLRVKFGAYVKIMMV